jgi:aromatic ring-opening dioxygenase catalytic subunit (LigB family)
MRLRRNIASVTAFLGLQRPTAASSNTTFNLLQGIQQFPLSSYSSNMTRLAPVISLSHGGGPMPLLGDPSHKDIVESLKTKLPKLLRLGTPSAPKAIVLVTAHWSTNKVAVSSGSKHELLYDYYGFPPESYEIKHDAPGSPEVAAEVVKALKEAGIDSAQDPTRGSYIRHAPFGVTTLTRPQAGTTASSSP